MPHSRANLTIKELPLEFDGKGEVKGWKFRQIASSEKGYVYEKSQDNSISYEVFHRKENSFFQCVSHPKSLSFGEWAWDFVDKEMAMKRFRDL